jgi:hypothetical protein
VKNYRRMAMIGALALCLAIVAGCHGTPGANTETWIKQADTSQVLELKFRHVSVLAQMHMAVFGNTVKGSYVLKNGSVATKGAVTRDRDEFLLVSTDGKKQRFSMDKSSLKDESGAIWNRKEGPVAVLREW